MICAPLTTSGTASRAPGTSVALSTAAHAAARRSRPSARVHCRTQHARQHSTFASGVRHGTRLTRHSRGSLRAPQRPCAPRAAPQAAASVQSLVVASSRHAAAPPPPAAGVADFWSGRVDGGRRSLEGAPNVGRGVGAGAGRAVHSSRHPWHDLQQKPRIHGSPHLPQCCCCAQVNLESGGTSTHGACLCAVGSGVGAARRFFRMSSPGRSLESTSCLSC